MELIHIIYVFNILIALLSLFWPLWFTSKYLHLHWINPFTITLAVTLPVQIMKLFGGPLVLIEEGIFDKGYQFALAMSSLLTLAQTGGLVFFLKLFTQLRIERWLPLKQQLTNPAGLLRAAWLLIIVFALALSLLATAEFGLMNWLNNPREGYQLYRTGQGHWYALAQSALSASFIVALMARPRAVWAISMTMLYICLAYLLGSKGALLGFFASGLIFLWFIRWKYLGRLFVFGMPALFALLVFNLFLALGDGFDLQSILEYFDYYKNAANYYSAHLAGEVPLFWGEVSLSSLWAYVPRTILPDKPVAYGILLVNEIFYPGQAELTNTPAFGGAVEQYADFGVVGVLVFGFFSASSLLTALTSHLIFKSPGLDIFKPTQAAVVLMLVQFAPAFGAYYPGGLYFVLVLSVIGLVRLCCARYSWRSGSINVTESST